MVCEKNPPQESGCGDSSSFAGKLERKNSPKESGSCDSLSFTEKLQAQTENLSTKKAPSQSKCNFSPLDNESINKTSYRKEMEIHDNSVCDTEDKTIPKKCASTASSNTCKPNEGSLMSFRGDCLQKEKSRETCPSSHNSEIQKDSAASMKRVDCSVSRKRSLSQKCSRQPIAEKGKLTESSCRQMENKKYKALSCPEKKTVPFMDFFPLDARNKKLTECIKKYSKLEPAQVIQKCSQFATEKCVDAVKRYQPHLDTTDKFMKSYGGRTVAKLQSSKGRELARRWVPSAAVYLTTATVFTIYVTEWKPVLRYVPFYSHLSQEEE